MKQVHDGPFVIHGWQKGGEAGCRSASGLRTQHWLHWAAKEERLSGVLPPRLEIKIRAPTGTWKLIVRNCKERNAKLTKSQWRLHASQCGFGLASPPCR
jgi:hypothetical protein